MKVWSLSVHPPSFSANSLRDIVLFPAEVRFQPVIFSFLLANRDRLTLRTHTHAYDFKTRGGWYTFATSRGAFPTISYVLTATITLERTCT
jgi:hypothetical protein